uniref:Uncharacterized protein n=1 Tax=Dulem virus 39 TaxID=3145757 RepID=A0AAU8B578_9CAUD
MGVSWQEFWTMNPRIIKLLIKGHEEKIKEQDCLAWLFNQYTLSAVSVAVEHCLAGRKAKSKYIEKTIMQQIEEKNKPLSEDELQRQRELFVAKLEVMKTNFELSHKGGSLS